MGAHLPCSLWVLGHAVLAHGHMQTFGPTIDQLAAHNIAVAVGLNEAIADGTDLAR